MQAFRIVGVLCFVLCTSALVHAAPAAKTAAPPTVTTSQVFSQYKDRLLQIRVIDATSNSQSVIGSGFFIDKIGTIVTNFHVISKHIYKPEQYRIEYVMHDGTVQKAKLSNIDVIHDLAILDAERLPTPHLKLSDTAIEKGERIYTMGNPLDLGMTIEESVYNGTTDDTMHERILLSGSLNPGMSGGPSITSDGTVAGINVAATGNNIGFLVPAQYLRKLLDVHIRPDKTNFLALVQQQLLNNQNEYIKALIDKPFPVKLLGNYAVPDKIAEYLNCWGDTDDKNRPFRTSSMACSIKNDIFLSGSFSTGEIRYNHHFFSGTDINPYRFYNVLQQNFASPAVTLSGSKHDVTEFNCQSEFVKQDELTLKVAFCLREYKKFKGIYDLVLSAVSLNEEKQGLVSTLILGGVSYDNAVAFSKNYLRAIKWNRP